MYDMCGEKLRRSAGRGPKRGKEARKDAGDLTTSRGNGKFLEIDDMIELYMEISENLFFCMHHAQASSDVKDDAVVAMITILRKHTHKHRGERMLRKFRMTALNRKKVSPTPTDIRTRLWGDPLEWGPKQPLRLS
ncbi:hypothetical protein RB195_003164 [Necator americanus]|uniref:Uncharacterized protein n=1 Tax=Necator americanus TaxID=51031 RepID=A0ABR1DMD4_NECAM